MTAWQRFLDTFFKPEMIVQYWPSIAQGVLVTVEIASGRGGHRLGFG